MTKKKFRFYKDHPKTCREDDFWGQVKRTVNGKPVSQDQIDLIVQAVVAGLELNKQDYLLDLCCGNGALSNLIFDHCNGGFGVDFSEYLISIAEKYFSKPQNRFFACHDVLDYCRKPTQPEQFTKMLCYGSFSYLEKANAEALLSLLSNNFRNLQRAFIGNNPDRNLMDQFFDPKQMTEAIADDPNSPIGIWRTQEEFITLAQICGWQCSIRKMPKNYYAAHYRYDVILTRE